DAKASHLAGHVAEHHVVVVELHAEHCVGQGLDHLALEFNLVLLCQLLASDLGRHLVPRPVAFAYRLKLPAPGPLRLDQWVTAPPVGGGVSFAGGGVGAAAGGGAAGASPGGPRRGACGRAPSRLPCERPPPRGGLPGPGGSEVWVSEPWNSGLSPPWPDSPRPVLAEVP